LWARNIVIFEAQRERRSSPAMAEESFKRLTGFRRERERKKERRKEERKEGRKERKKERKLEKIGFFSVTGLLNCVVRNRSTYREISRNSRDTHG
jgi:hypothetical protein